MPITVEQDLDLIATTQRELGKLRWTEIATDVQEHTALPMILKKEKVQFEDGTGIQRNVMIDHSGAAKFAKLFEVDDVNVADVMATFNIPWRHATTNYAIERREMAMNRGASRLVDLVKVRRADAMISLAELLEGMLWSYGLTDDGITPFGITYWLTKSATEGFNGLAHSAFASGKGGFSNARWRNWTADYNTVTKDDLIRKMRKGYVFTKFKPIVPHPDYARGGDRYGIYMGYDELGLFEELAEAQNENLLNDLASKDGRTLFRGVPLTRVAELEADTDDPIYFINWSCFYPVFLRGEYMREEGPRVKGDQHTTYVTHIDLTVNTLCTNLRKQAVFSKAQANE
jgi:hypothetical protein